MSLSKQSNSEPIQTKPTLSMKKEDTKRVSREDAHPEMNKRTSLSILFKAVSRLLGFLSHYKKEVKAVPFIAVAIIVIVAVGVFQNFFEFGTAVRNTASLLAVALGIVVLSATAKETGRFGTALAFLLLLSIVFFVTSFFFGWPREFSRLFERTSDVEKDRLHAQMGMANAALHQRRYPEAEGAFATILKSDTNNVRALKGMAVCLYMRGKLDPAERFYKLALASIYKNTPFEADDLIAIRNDLAQVLEDKGHYDSAEVLMRRNLNFEKQRLGNAHPNVATQMNNLGALFIRRADCESIQKAEVLFTNALSIDLSAFGALPVLQVATDFNNIGYVRYLQGRLTESAEAYRKALEIDRAYPAEDAFEHSLHLNNFALVLIAQGKLGDAETELRRALSLAEASPSNPSGAIRNRKQNLAMLLVKKGEFQEAQRLMEATLREDESVYDHAHMELATDYNNLGELFLSLTNCARARECFDQALGRSRLRKDGPDMAFILINGARCEAHASNLLSAQEMIEQAIGILDKEIDRFPNELARALNVQGEILVKRGATAEASTVFMRALELYETNSFPCQLRFDPAGKARVLFNQGMLFRSGKNAAVAKEKISQALSLFEAALGREAKETKTARIALADL